MTDRELMELAAKAAGIDLMQWFLWNPLTDDGDALRLAVKLELTEVWFDKSTGRPEVVCGKHGTGICVEPLRDDPCAATRRAIVRAAAEIGRAIVGASCNSPSDTTGQKS